MVRRHIFEQDGQVMVATEGCGFREKGPFMALMREMQGQTDALRDSMTGKAAPPTSDAKP